MLTDAPGNILVRTLCHLSGSLSPRAATKLAGSIGDARRIIHPREAATVRRNLQILGLAENRTGSPPVSGIEPVEQLVRQTFRSFGLFIVEFFRGLTLTPEQIASGWRVTGWDHLQRAVSSRRGVILAGAHTGNWEHLGAIAALLGRRIVAPVEVQFHPLISEAVKRAKRRSRIESVPAARNLRDLLRCLDRGDLVAIPLDGGEYRQGVPVRLLGKQVRLAGGAARLALLSGRPIVPVFSRRTAFMRQELRVCEPICPPAHRDGCSERVITQRLADLLGEQIHRAPDQWCIFRPLPWYH
jgi:KDO2-lipid IV(A) lauroyltransferase